MGVVTLGSPSFDPTPLASSTVTTSGAPVKVVGGSASTAMISESDPIFTAWDRSTGITINSTQITSDSADIVPLGLACPSQGITVGTQSAYVTLAWTAISSSTFSHYRLRYKRNSFSVYTYLNIYTVNTTLIEGLVPNTLYDFSIASVNTTGVVSAYSANVPVTTSLDSTLPATITGVSATAGIKYVLLKWTAGGDADIASYNIYRYTSDSSGSSSKVGNTSGTTFIDGGLTAGVAQFYWIKGVDTSGNISASYSSTVNATPTVDFDQTALETALGADLGDLAIIDPITGYIGAGTVGTLQLDTGAVEAANIHSGAVTAAKLNVTAISATGDLNINTVGTTQISTSAITHALLANDAIEANNIATGAVTGPAIEASAILAGHIGAGQVVATHILTGALEARHITSFNFMVTEGTFTSNSPTAGKVAWAGCKVVYDGVEYTIVDGSCLATDVYIYWEYPTGVYPDDGTTFSTSATLPTLGDNDFIVATNDSGTYLLAWNSTIINGNRLTTGSVTATQIGAGAIIAGKIEAGTIVAADIAASTITADKLNTYNFQLITDDTFLAELPTANQISWIECEVMYNGTKSTVVAGACDVGDIFIYWQPSNPLVFGHATVLPATINDSFLVATNGSSNYNVGTPVYAWNNSSIDGNRIITGSLHATTITAGSITANQIATNAITLSEINFVPVVEGNVIAKINASAEGINITADRLTLSGTISATGGDIGGWDISANSIYKGTETLGNGYSPNGITISADGSIHAEKFYINVDGTCTFSATNPILDGIRNTVFEIGVWNMTATDHIDIAHGLADHTKIRNVEVILIGDDGIRLSLFHMSGGYWQANATNIVLWRQSTGGDGYGPIFYNNATFDGASANRGYVTMQYEV